MESEQLSSGELQELLVRQAVNPQTSHKSAAYAALQEIALTKAVPVIAQILESGTEADRLRAASIAFRFGFGSKVEVFVDNTKFASSLGAALARSGLDETDARKFLRELINEVESSQ